MNEPRKSNQKDIVELLETLRETPPQDPSALDHSRSAYLEQLNSLPGPVSPGRFWRHKWHTNTAQFRLRTLTIVVVLLFAVLGSGAITVSAAQTAIPGEQLYPVKIWFEDFRLALAFSDTRKLELHLEFAAERLAELDRLEDLGLSHIPDQLSDDFFHHIQDASLLLHDEDDDRGYSTELEDLLSQFDDLESGEGEWEEPEDGDRDDNSDSSTVEEEDSDDASDQDEGEDEESEEIEGTEEPIDSTQDLEEEDRPTEGDDDPQTTQTPEETEEPDETEEPEETNEPEDPNDND